MEEDLNSPLDSTSALYPRITVSTYRPFVYDVYTPDVLQYRVCYVDDSEWLLPMHFRYVRTLGGGSYGSVAEFIDTISEGVVAIKRVADVFRDVSDARRILREIKVLRHLQSSEYVTRILDILPPVGVDFGDLYIVLECAETDLHKAIYKEEELDSGEIRPIFQDLLRAFAMIHRAGLIHRDVKPSNIMLNARGVTVKVGDFGLARDSKILERTVRPSSRVNTSRAKFIRFDDAPGAPDVFYNDLSSHSTVSPPPSIPPYPPSDKKEPTYRSFARRRRAIPSPCRIRGGAPPLTGSDLMTEYIVTRWYRPPEVLLNNGVYGPGLDIWGLGCIFAELLLGRPLYPGKDNVEQMRMITKSLGTPEATDYAALFATPMRYVSRQIERVRRAFLEAPHNSSGDLQKLLRVNCGVVVSDLITKMLRYDPARRLTAQEALEHPFFGRLRNRNLKSLRNLPVMDYDFDEAPLMVRSIRKRIYEEVVRYWHPEIIERDLLDLRRRDLFSTLELIDMRRNAFYKKEVNDERPPKSPYSDRAMASLSTTESSSPPTPSNKGSDTRRIEVKNTGHVVERPVQNTLRHAESLGV